MAIYQKPPITVSQVLERLKAQGLIYEPDELTKKLSLVSYYRLSTYFTTFYLPESQHFQSDVIFADIWRLYEFDRLLRHLVSEALEPIEVAFRTAISEKLSHQYGTHWFLKPELFKHSSFQAKLLVQMKDICSSGADPDIKHYMSRYKEPPLPPSWLMIEKLSFGACVNIFRYLKHLKDKKAIASVFDYHPTALESWLEALRYTRNLCAHHERLWNRWFVWSPKLDYLYQNADQFKNSFYAQAIIIERLLETILPDMGWKEELYALMEANTFLPFEHMGFQMSWKQDSFWESRR